MRQSSYDSLADEEQRDSEIFGDSGHWGGEKNRGRRQRGVNEDEEYGGRNVETNYDDYDDDDSFGNGNGGNFLGTGLLESKSSLVSIGGGGGESSLSRVASMRKTVAMNNDVESYLRTRAEDYDQMMSNTFNQKTSMGTPPVSRLSDDGDENGDSPFSSSSSNPFASSSDMFDKSFRN
jgi:hypothetical protein